jgi:hypothetical protein
MKRALMLLCRSVFFGQLVCGTLFAVGCTSHSPPPAMTGAEEESQEPEYAELHGMQAALRTISIGVDEPKMLQYTLRRSDPSLPWALKAREPVIVRFFDEHGQPLSDETGLIHLTEDFIRGRVQRAVALLNVNWPPNAMFATAMFGASGLTTARIRLK